MTLIKVEEGEINRKQYWVGCCVLAERRVWVHHTVMASTQFCSTSTGALGKEEEVRTPRADWNSIR